MACLALALQPVNGPDVLLQTREWFPPARAAYASSSFRTTRVAYAAGKQISVDVVGTGLGDEALSTASGQVVVGKENKYKVVYRLVNTVYVLGITSAHQDVSVNNIFECANIVNQTVSVLVAACKGIDVSTEKVSRKYTEIYMTLDAVLHGVSAARLSFILSSIHGDNVGQVFLSATDAENRSRGAESWNQVKNHPAERLANVDVLSNATFEVPEETLAAGDEYKVTLAPPAQPVTPAQPAQQEKPAEDENEDPFAASDAINKPEALAGRFKKAKEVKDVTAGLAELEVPTVAPTASEFVGVEGFEGEYGGLDFNDDYGGGFGDAFEGLTDAFGGGLDASDYTAPKDHAVASGLAGLEELEGGGDGKKDGTKSKESTTKTETGGDLASELVTTGAHEGDQRKDVKVVETRTPLLWFTEEIYAEFKGLVVSRTGLQGALYLRTADPNGNGTTDTEFSFSLEGAAGIKNGVMKSSITSNLGQGFFHVRAPPSSEPLTILKYRLHPRFTPLPLRMRLIAKKVGFLLSVMIQYVANPYLPTKLKDVAFVLCLPESPASLKVSPRAAFDNATKEIRWQIGEIASPGRLRAQFPLDTPEQSTDDDAALKKLNLKVRVEFTCKGQTLSGISLRPATDHGKEEFYVGEHSFKTGQYECLL